MFPSFMKRMTIVLAERRDDRRRRREAAAVDREATQRVIADPDDVLGRAEQLVVAGRRILRLDDERAEQPAPDLVGRVVVRVVHVRARRPRDELVGERIARLDRVLGDVRHAVHVVGQLLAVEMDARALVHVVLEGGANPVPLDDREARARPRAVEAERLHWLLLGVDGVVHLLDGQLEDLDAVLDPGLEREVARSRHGRSLAAEEPLDRGLGVRVVIHRRAGRGCGRWRGRSVGHRRRSRRRGGRRARRGAGREAGALAPGRSRATRGAGGQADGDQAGAGDGSGPQEPASAQGGRLRRIGQGG